MYNLLITIIIKNICEIYIDYLVSDCCEKCQIIDMCEKYYLITRDSVRELKKPYV